MELKKIDKLKDWAEEFIFNRGIEKYRFEGSSKEFISIDKVTFILRDANRHIKDYRTIEHDSIIFIDQRCFNDYQQDIENIRIEGIRGYEQDNEVIVHLKEKVWQKPEEEERSLLLSDIKEKENKSLYNQSLYNKNIMKIKFRVSTDELVHLVKEMSNFLEANKGQANFKRFYTKNQVVEEGFFTFDLNIHEGYDHKSGKWAEGAVTTVEIGTKKGECFKCLTRSFGVATTKEKGE